MRLQDRRENALGSWLTSLLFESNSKMDLKEPDNKRSTDFQVDIISESLRELQQGMRAHYARLATLRVMHLATHPFASGQTSIF